MTIRDFSVLRHFSQPIASPHYLHAVLRFLAILTGLLAKLSCALLPRVLGFFFEVLAGSDDASWFLGLSLQVCWEQEQGSASSPGGVMGIDDRGLGLVV